MIVYHIQEKSLCVILLIEKHKISAYPESPKKTIHIKGAFTVYVFLRRFGELGEK